MPLSVSIDTQISLRGNQLAPIQTLQCTESELYQAQFCTSPKPKLMIQLKLKLNRQYKIAQVKIKLRLKLRRKLKRKLKLKIVSGAEAEGVLWRKERDREDWCPSTMAQNFRIQKVVR